MSSREGDKDRQWVTINRRVTINCQPQPCNLYPQAAFSSKQKTCHSSKEQRQT